MSMSTSAASDASEEKKTATVEPVPSSVPCTETEPVTTKAATSRIAGAFEDEWWKEMCSKEREFMDAASKKASDSTAQRTAASHRTNESDAYWADLELLETEYLRKKAHKEYMAAEREEKRKRKEESAKRKTADPMAAATQLDGFFARPKKKGTMPKGKTTKKQGSKSSAVSQTTVISQSAEKGAIKKRKIKCATTDSISISSAKSKRKAKVIDLRKSPTSLMSAMPATVGCIPEAEKESAFLLSDATVVEDGIGTVTSGVQMETEIIASEIIAFDESANVSKKDKTATGKREAKLKDFTVRPVLGGVVERHKPIHSKTPEHKSVLYAVSAEDDEKEKEKAKKWKPPVKKSKFKMRLKSKKGIKEQRQLATVPEDDVDEDTCQKPRVGKSATESKTLQSAASIIACSSLSGPLPVKVLFLDVDGVLNSRSTFGIGVMDQLSDAHMRRLLRVFQATHCKVVLSTSWRRIARAKSTLLAVLRKVLSKDAVIGETPVLATKQRPHEIGAWLRRAKDSGRYKVTHWAAIDDLPLDTMSPECASLMRGHFVKTYFETGMTDANAKRAIAILNGYKQPAIERPPIGGAAKLRKQRALASGSAATGGCKRKGERVRLLFVNPNEFLLNSPVQFREQSDGSGVVFECSLLGANCAKLRTIVRTTQCRVALLADWAHSVPPMFDAFKRQLNDLWKMDELDSVFVEPLRSTFAIHPLFAICDYVSTRFDPRQCQLKWAVLDAAKRPVAYPRAVLSGLVFTDTRLSFVKPIVSFFNS